MFYSGKHPRRKSLTTLTISRANHHAQDSIRAAAVITRLDGPSGLAVFGNKLFVANFGAGTVGKYNALTGAAISPSFITGLNGPSGLAVLGPTPFFPHAILVVASEDASNGMVGNSATGVAINPSFITGLITTVGLTVG